MLVTQRTKLLTVTETVYETQFLTIFTLLIILNDVLLFLSETIYHFFLIKGYIEIDKVV